MTTAPVKNSLLREAAEALAAGELVVIPTARWYMVCANAADPVACRRIFRAKRRPSARSLVHVAPSIEACRSLYSLNTAAEKLIEAFWPGDLALMLPWLRPEDSEQHRAVGSPALVTLAPGVLGALAKASTVPIAATSVNVSAAARPGSPLPAITMDEVRGFFTGASEQPAVIIDGGICPAAAHLTIVDCATAQHPRLVRHGLVHQIALEAALGGPLADRDSS